MIRRSDDVNAREGVPPAQMQPGSGSALYSSLVPRCGVPLRSVTRIARPQLFIVLLLIGSTVIHSCEQSVQPIAQQHRPALPSYPFWNMWEERDTAALGREVDSLTIILASDTTYAAGYLRRGQLAIAASRPGNLLADFDKAIALDSTLAEAYFSRGAMGQMLESHSRPLRGCKDIQKAASLGFQVPDLWDECLIPKWDTLTIGKQWRFVPLRAFLVFSLYDRDDRILIKQGLTEKDLPIDSVWIDPQHHTIADSATITLDLYWLSGIVEELELEASGQMSEGNWSGRDGTLRIDKTTGKSTYLLWQ